MNARNDSPRWCATCNAYGDHHTDRHRAVSDTRTRLAELISDELCEAGTTAVEGENTP